MDRLDVERFLDFGIGSEIEMDEYEKRREKRKQYIFLSYQNRFVYDY